MNIAIIPARGGSRRIPRKNIRPFFGRPIIAYSIEVAQQCGLFSGVVVSTEDDQFGRMAEGYGATWYQRPGSLARDDVGTQEIVADVLRWQLAYDENWQHACCIYPCAPMLEPGDLIHARNVMLDEGVPYAYADGWYYFGAAQAFIEDVPLARGVRNMVNVARYIDINTEADWQRAEAMYAALHPEVTA